MKRTESSDADWNARLIEIAATDIEHFSDALLQEFLPRLQDVFAPGRDTRALTQFMEECYQLRSAAVLRVPIEHMRPLTRNVNAVLRALNGIIPQLEEITWSRRHQPVLCDFMQQDPDIARNDIQQTLESGDLDDLFRYSHALQEAESFIWRSQTAWNAFIQCMSEFPASKELKTNDHDSESYQVRALLGHFSNYECTDHDLLAREMLPQVLTRLEELTQQVGIRESLRSFDRVASITRNPEDDYYGDKIGSFDKVLGIAVVGRHFDTSEVERAGDLDQQIVYMGTPYSMIRDFYRTIPNDRPQTVYDLGCGVGRVVLYGALTREHSTVKGIELVPGYAAIAEEARRRHKVENAEIINANVLDVDFSDGDTFFLFNPFSTEVLVRVLERLNDIARRKTIRIAAWGPCTWYFARCPWLRVRSLTGQEGRNSLRLGGITLFDGKRGR